MRKKQKHRAQTHVPLADRDGEPFCEMTEAPDLSPTSAQGSRLPLEIIYDGECPFCRGYVQMARLRDAAGPVRLVDGRAHPEIAAKLYADGIDLNETMVVNYGGVSYAGPRAIELLSMLSSNAGFLNRASAWLLRDKRRADFFYPLLRFGRNSALRLLGKDKIDIPRAS
jgi:predicted DCC family thiol-disulfide oxidoreductase YuxK